MILSTNEIIILLKMVEKFRVRPFLKVSGVEFALSEDDEDFIREKKIERIFQYHSFETFKFKNEGKLWTLNIEDLEKLIRDIIGE